MAGSLLRIHIITRKIVIALREQARLQGFAFV